MTATEVALLLVGAGALAVWVFLIVGRRGFWRADERLTEVPAPDAWPAVLAVVPARNEARTIALTVASILGQDYPASLSLVVVDDASEDGTADAARAAAGDDDRFDLVSGRPLKPGWTGKLWALEQGLARGAERMKEARYVFLTDADVEHDAGQLRHLVAKAEADRLDLVSLMVMLQCRTFWERHLIPAFVFFFQKLYPFPKVNDLRSRAAAAAGGCILVGAEALRRIGAFEAIRDRVIDDCALARAVKRSGPIWIGLTTASRSLRGYEGLGGLWAMIARTAFVQLRHSTLLVFASVLGLIVTYLAPPALAVAGIVFQAPLAALLGAAAWVLMAASYRPTLALYGESAWRALLLPVAAALYALMTIDSARRHLRGRGGGWKGRHYPPARRR
ncbi:MAG: glycosyltransferase [Rhodospirillales bacterium]|nr:glycosyltransferase [Rhodospirillales bacterium]MDP6804842.1 glycosyltransferase [Rhodospirillales bacterium]